MTREISSGGDAMAFDRKAYMPKHDKACRRQISLNLNVKYDKEILAWLDEKPNKQGYIKKLIIDDMQKG